MKKRPFVLALVLCLLLVSASIQLSFAASDGYCQNYNQQIFKCNDQYLIKLCNQSDNNCQKQYPQRAYNNCRNNCQNQCPIKACYDYRNNCQNQCPIKACYDYRNNCQKQCPIWTCYTPQSEYQDARLIDTYFQYGNCYGNKCIINIYKGDILEKVSEPGKSGEVIKEDDEDQKIENNTAAGEYPSKVAEITNKERKAQNLSSLTFDDELCRLAQMKAQDMADRNYFSHTSPTYGSAGDMVKAAGYSYKFVGENIAKGQQTPATVMAAWMKSSGHKANILGDYTKIGVGYAKGRNGTTYWVQIFAR